jgi:hypothetical protein
LPEELSSVGTPGTYSIRIKLVPFLFDQPLQSKSDMSASLCHDFVAVSPYSPVPDADIVTCHTDGSAGMCVEEITALSTLSQKVISLIGFSAGLNDIDVIVCSSLLGAV